MNKKDQQTLSSVSLPLLQDLSIIQPLHCDSKLDIYQPETFYLTDLLVRVVGMRCAWAGAQGFFCAIEMLFQGRHGCVVTAQR